MAGGKGTRLHPTTQVISKQLLPIYDKPLVYYPLSVLILAGISEILIISSPDDLPLYEKLLGNGSRIGLELHYVTQPEPNGLGEAFLLGEDFIGTDSVALVLGDNVFYGQSFSDSLELAKKNVEKGGATIFAYPVADPKEFGVVELNEKKQPLSLEEKPTSPKSAMAVPGLYFYDNTVVKIAKQCQPSQRGELEITSINRQYLAEKRLKVLPMGRGMAWLDTGTPRGMLKAAQFVQTVQDMQGFYLSCIEEVAWRKGFISIEQVKKLGLEMKNTEYGQYLINLWENFR